MHGGSIELTATNWPFVINLIVRGVSKMTERKTRAGRSAYGIPPHPRFLQRGIQISSGLTGPARDHESDLICDFLGTVTTQLLPVLGLH